MIKKLVLQRNWRRYNDPNWAISVVGFHTDFKDLIVLDNSNSDSEPENAGNVVTKGIELSMDYLPPEEYQLLLQEIYPTT